MLFTPDGAGGGHYKAVPERYVAFPDLQLSRAEWDSLQIPVGVAFFFVNSSIDRVAAFYPGPAGATESLLPLDTWEELAIGHPELATLQPDVEAFLVRRRTRRRRGGVLPRADRHVLRAGRSVAQAVAGLRRRAGGAPGPRSTFLEVRARAS